MIRIVIITLVSLIFLFSSCWTEAETPVVIDNIVPTEIQPIVSPIDTNIVPSTTSNLVSNPAHRLVDTIEKKWDLRTEMTRTQFEETSGAELEMLLIRPIYSKIFDLDENDTEVIPQLTEGQKGLYFFRKMDEAMTEGGVESLYKTQLPQYLPIIAETFKGIDIPDLGIMAEKAAIEHRRLNSIASPDNIQIQDPYMNKFDNEFSKNHNSFYKGLEDYIRKHPEEFIKFTD